MKLTLQRNTNKQMKKEFLTWEQVVLRGFDTVIVESYGYDEVNVFGTHFEPFKNKRSLTFAVSASYDEKEDGSLFINPNKASLTHNWLNLSDLENDLQFELREDGKVYLNDPELWAN